MARRLAARPGAEPRCRTSCEEASARSAARNRGSTPAYDRSEAAAGIALYAGPAAVPVGGGRAPQSITTERPEHQRCHKQHNDRHHTNAPRHTKNRHPDRMSACGGARGIRTPDLLIANETRYQLRHSPKDSNSLAPSQSATQADHRRVRHAARA